MKPNKNKKGYLVIQALVIGTVAMIILGGIINWAGINIKGARRVASKEKAFQIAEAGIEYYRWHLAHSPSDYQDGTATSGPYIHNFYDKDGNLTGTFSLDIVPPPSGSTVVIIKSTGKVAEDSAVQRTIEATLGITSFSKYAVVANDEMRFDHGTEVFGPIHANGGVRFDGVAHNIISSSIDAYNDPDHEGGDEFGVHTHVNRPPLTGIEDRRRDYEAPPNSVEDRPDVFMAGRQFPVPAIDFVGITTNLADLKTEAQNGGRYFPDSGKLGYHVVLKTDDTFDLYKVNTLAPVPNGCTNVHGQQDWGTWSIKSGGETFLQNYSIPENGIIFLEDNVWVDGQINTARVTIASAKIGASSAHYTHLTVNNDLLYTNYDGQDVVSLMAQGNINVGMYSEDDLRIDAALIAQNGRIGRYYYRKSNTGSRCDPYDERQVLTLFGMLGTNERYGFWYDDDTGYLKINVIYDANLLYGPPPSFPLTTDQYEIISWREI